MYLDNLSAAYEADHASGNYLLLYLIIMYYILYKTTNLTNNKIYIGIHQANKLDDNYLGSGTALLHAIKKYGKENFKREVLELCNSYTELTELEKKYVNEEFLIDKNNYNLKTGGGNFGTLSDESKKKISETLKRKYKSGEIKLPNHNKGRVVPEQDKKKISKTLKERYKIIEHHSKGIKILNRKKCSTEIWNKNKKGLQIVTPETKQKISKTLKDRYENSVHHLKNKVPWNKGLKINRPSWNKGLKANILKCTYCLKEIAGESNAKRWHFDNCKLKSSTNPISTI